MKHFTLLLAAIMMAAAASAKVMPNKAASLKSLNRAEQMTPEQAEKNAVKNVKFRQCDFSAVNKQMKAPRSRAVGDEILEAEGDFLLYEDYSTGFYVNWFFQAFGTQYNLKEVILGENNEVYFFDFLNTGLETYVKGQYADGEITIDFPQTLASGYDEDDEGNEYEIEYSATVCKYDPDQDTYVNCDADECHVVLTVDAEGTFTLKLNPDYDIESGEIPEYIIAAVDDVTPGAAAFLGYGDALQTWKLLTREIVEVPEDAEIEQWAMTFTDDSGYKSANFVDVAICGDEIYVGGIYPDFPDGWAKGTIKDGKAYFATEQLEGIAYVGYFLPVFFMSGVTTEEYDEEWEEYYLNTELNEGITFSYDADKKVLVAEGEGSTVLINARPDAVYYYTMAIEPTIKWQDPEACKGAPVDPYVQSFEPWDPEFFGGQGSITWMIPPYNVNGALLNTENMYYHFLIDGEVYGFDPDLYTTIPEYMEDVPYTFSDDWDIYVSDDLHQIYFYVDGAETFGLQSFYVDEDGETYASAIVTYVPETDGANGIKFNEVVDTKYYDITGREIANPQSGLYIKSMKLADGKVRNVKVIMK